MMKTGPEQNGSNIFSDIQGEVGAEQAPLLQFIIKYASWITSGVIILLIILGAMALWNWHQTTKLEEAQNQLSEINLKMSGQEKEKALQTLLETAPDNLKVYIYLELAQTAQENGNTDLALSSYNKATELGESSALGFAAQLGAVAMLLSKGEYPQALAKMQGMAQASPNMAQMPQFRLLLAEIAEKADNKELALQTWQELASQAPEREAAYYKQKIRSLQPEKESQ